MNGHGIHDEADDAPIGIFSRPRTLALVLIVATGVVVYLCYRLVQPFLPALAWALALAVVADPLHRRLERRIGLPNVSAMLSVVIVLLIIVVPAVLVTHRIVQETGRYARTLQDELVSGRWRSAVQQSPTLSPLVDWIDTQLPNEPAPPDERGTSDGQQSDETGASDGQQPGDAAQQETTVPAGSGRAVPALGRAASAITGGVTSFVTGAIWFGMQMFVTLMALFFFLRDRRRALDGLRSLLPLSDSEADEVFARVDDTIYATVFGSLVVAGVQGFLGGLIFWWLDLPSPLVWGAVMGLLAVIPVLGAFVIWMPVAIYLAIQGDWTKALILAAWGSIAIGLIDNLLYPVIVGKRMRFHTLLVFIAIVGGLILFGASGIVLGPVLLAISDALLDVWRRRTAGAGVLEQKPAV